MMFIRKMTGKGASNKTPVSVPQTHPPPLALDAPEVAAIALESKQPSAAKEVRAWNVLLLPQDVQDSTQHILQRDFDRCWDDEHYPVVLDKNGNLAWKEDVFVCDLIVQGRLIVDFTALALDPDPAQQKYRRRLYKRLGYTIEKYNDVQK